MFYYQKKIINYDRSTLKFVFGAILNLLIPMCVRFIKIKTFILHLTEFIKCISSCR